MFNKSCRGHQCGHFKPRWAFISILNFALRLFENADFGVRQFFIQNDITQNYLAEVISTLFGYHVNYSGLGAYEWCKLKQLDYYLNNNL